VRRLHIANAGENGCGDSLYSAPQTEEEAMIKVSVFYENVEGKKFDLAYYCNKHMPMVKQKLGAACKRVEVEQGLGGAQPGSKPAFIAMGHMLFDSVDAFQKAFTPTPSWQIFLTTPISSRSFNSAK